ncbi:DinB family [Treponema primitia ZAS-2]|uniref:DinB family n=1 Tax=Treponema primitia (strain ATCC BAA-887 / DSM 12427 / ZAS-2) TaxID=545694 RepID=F5YMT7_TREPZ|nr:DinB family protein [Treponema primitia]AEF83711.1 DinB family [Treponema primitia ZAS-2]
MKQTFLMYAKYLQDKDKKIAALLDGLSNDEREKDRGSYYKSLSGLFRHVTGAQGFFLGTLQSSLPGNSKAKLVPLPDAKALPEGILTEAQWKELKAFSEKADQALVDFLSALSDEDLKIHAKWFSGDMVPLSFMLSQLLVHAVHHQGAISQILDEMKIDNDFSGIGVKFL